MRRALALLTLLPCLLLAGCSDDPDVSSTSCSRAAAPSAASPSPVDAPADEAPSASAPVFPASTDRDEQEPTGGPLSVTEVRVARHDGYDRVVFELDGREPGQPGWTVQYVDDPRQDGSGNPVEVEGEAVLSVTITGTGYPMDTGVDEVTSDPALPGDLQVVQDVVLGAVFEGQYEAFIGTSGKAPFRVFRLDDPARVVVDVRVE